MLYARFFFRYLRFNQLAMEIVKLELDADGKGRFYIEQNGVTGAEMFISIKHDKLTISHTEVLKELEGHGLAKALFNEMVTYARQHQLHVIPQCPYVFRQLKKNPEMYADIY